MKKLLILLFLITNIHLFATNYYVSTAVTSSNTNDGKSETKAWRTIAHAAGRDSYLVQGDTVFIKAGNYGNENAVITRSGTPLKPIVFKGYKTYPREIIPPLVNFDNNYSGLMNFDVSKMPTLIGTSRNSGIAFEVRTATNIIIQNFQVENYECGFSVGYPNYPYDCSITFINCNANKIGNKTISYSGAGFRIGNFKETKFVRKAKVYNCLVLNSAYEGIQITGDENEVMNCMVVSNDLSTMYAGTDYYISISGSKNKIQYCSVKRLYGSYSKGFGIGVRDIYPPNGYPPSGFAVEPTENTISYCWSYNMGECFYVKHKKTKNNKFYKCVAYGIEAGQVSRYGSCVMIKEGASDNSFDAMLAMGCESGIKFSDTQEDYSTEPNYTNTITNSEFNECDYGIFFHTDNLTSDAGSNRILNNTFRRCKYMFQCDRPSTLMVYYNNIFFGDDPVNGYFKGGNYGSSVKGIQFNYCNFYHIYGGLPVGQLNDSRGCIQLNPLFLSPTDSHLQTNSPCKYSGLIMTGLVPRDYDNQVRTDPTSMGAFK